MVPPGLTNPTYFDITKFKIRDQKLKNKIDISNIHTLGYILLKDMHLNAQLKYNQRKITFNILKLIVKSHYFKQKRVFYKKKIKKFGEKVLHLSFTMIIGTLLNNLYLK